MQLSITGHHINITSALRDYVDNKLERLERHFENVTDIHCILSVEKLRHKAEATVQVSGQRCLRTRCRKICTRPSTG